MGAQIKWIKHENCPFLFQSKYLSKFCLIISQNLNFCLKNVEFSSEISKFVKKSFKNHQNFSIFLKKAPSGGQKMHFFVKILISVNFFFIIHVFQTFFERSVKLGSFPLNIFPKKRLLGAKNCIVSLKFSKSAIWWPKSAFFKLKFFKKHKNWQFSTLLLQKRHLAAKTCIFLKKRHLVDKNCIFLRFFTIFLRFFAFKKKSEKNLNFLKKKKKRPLVAKK